MSKKITEKREIPAAACMFSVPVRLAEPEVDDEEEDDEEAAEDEEDDDESDDSESADDGEKDDEEGMSAKASAGQLFSVIANSGKPMRNTWYWGTLGIELSGIRAKDRVPALLDHRVDQPIGVYESRDITDEGLVMKGKFLKSSKLAQKVNAELRDGFPYEASVRLHPLKILELAAGEKSTVNGHAIEGPASIFLESELRETSIVTLGQDQHTQAAALSESPQVQVEFTRSATGKDTSMTQTKTGDAKTIAEEAVAGERTRIATLRKLALPEQSALLEEMISDGTSVADGTAKLHADLQTRFKAQADTMRSTGDASLSGGNGGGNENSQLAKVRKMPPSEKRFRKEFELDPKLQEEFCDVEDYVALSLQEAGL